MHDAQRPQALDQAQFARVEVVKLLIAFHQLRELRQALIALATAEHHPQVLHRWAHAAVIQVDHMEAVVAAQQVARMAVAMHPNRRVRGAGKQAVQACE